MITALHDVRLAAGPQAIALAHLWQIMLWVCVGVFASVMAALAIALWRAPHAAPGARVQRTTLALKDRRLFVGVAVSVALSTALLFILLIVSFDADRALASLPVADAVHIDLVAHQYWWEARYEADDPTSMFSVANELHIPVNRPVVLTLRSDDVIHSFWIPSLTGKKDMIPGHTATIGIRADTVGTYSGACAEFCGYQHAHMTLYVFADEPKVYQQWVTEQRVTAAAPANERARRGYELVVGGTCAMCHTIRGTIARAERAPDLTHVASRHMLGAGTLANDPVALANWIADAPLYKPGVNMPAMRYPADDLGAMVDYLTTLK